MALSRTALKQQMYSQAGQATVLVWLLSDEASPGLAHALGRLLDTLSQHMPGVQRLCSLRGHSPAVCLAKRSLLQAQISCLCALTQLVSAKV